MDKWEKKRRAKEWTWADEIRAFKKQLGMEKEKRSWAEEIEAIDKRKTVTTLAILAAIGVAIGIVALAPETFGPIIAGTIGLLLLVGVPIAIVLCFIWGLLEMRR